MSAQDYTTKLPVFEAMTDDEVKIPNMPIDRFNQRGENLYHWCQDDQDKLTANGLDWTYAEDLPVRAGACREAESIWSKEKKTRKEAAKAWKVQYPLAEKLKSDLLHQFRYAFRKDEELLVQVVIITEGDGAEDTIQDLNDLSVLGKANIPLLEAVNADLTKLDTAATTADSLATLLAEVNGDRNEPNAAKKVRDKAYTHLKEAMDEVIDCGRYVFRNDPDRLKGYRSPYSD